MHNFSTTEREMDRHSTYYDFRGIAERAAKGEHRTVVGGLWDEVGALQLDVLRANGLRRDSRLLDIGCGSLRLGVRAVDYLEASHYWGTDINESLLTAGFEKEIVPGGLAAKLPRSNLVVDGDFTFSGLPHDFDFVIAQSVFTHLPLNHMRLCLANLAEHLNGPCTFFMTVFIASPEQVSKAVLQQPGGIKTYPHRDPYHYLLSDIQHAAAGLPWSVEFVGDWNHPRNQKMVIFRKAGPSSTPASRPTRQLSVADAGTLRSGADHYRAYVGPPDRYDFMSSTQFALLFALGLRDYHRVLDFGCGSLRLGRLLIPFLQESRYFGIDPNKWLIEDALDRELGRDILTIKRPIFSYNDDFSTEVFQTKFDYIMAQSVLTHAGPDIVDTFLDSASRTLCKSGLLLFSYLRTRPPTATPLADNGWHYPRCVTYAEDWMLRAIERHGLHSTALPWFHPGAFWMAASRSPSELPGADQMRFLTGTVLRTPQFAASTHLNKGRG